MERWAFLSNAMVVISLSVAAVLASKWGDTHLSAQLAGAAAGIAAQNFSGRMLSRINMLPIVGLLLGGSFA